MMGQVVSFFEKPRRRHVEDIEAKLFALCQEWAGWCDERGLGLGSANAHVDDERLTNEERAYIRDFCLRWWKVEHPEDDGP